MTATTSTTTTTTSSSTPAFPPAEQSARKKDASREGRLSFKNFGEHQLRRDFKDQAVTKCRSTIDEFGKCAKESGLMVVWNCRGHNRAVVELWRFIIRTRSSRFIRMLIWRSL